MTASVDSVRFESAIRLGEVVVLDAVVTRAFRTSMEIALVVHAENNVTGERRACNEAHFTFVALDADRVPVAVPPVAPQTEAEQAAYDAAGRRRDARLSAAER